MAGTLEPEYGMDYEEAVEVLRESIVKDPGINLRHGEICLFSCDVAAMVSKALHVGGEPEYMAGRMKERSMPDIEEYEGILYLTSERVILIASQGGFALKNRAITDMQILKDGLLVFSKGKSHAARFPGAEKLRKVMEAAHVYVMKNKSWKKFC